VSTAAPNGATQYELTRHVVSTDLDYLRPAVLGDDIVVRTDDRL
jgi:hypothetical protein